MSNALLTLTKFQHITKGFNFSIFVYCCVSQLLIAELQLNNTTINKNWKIETLCEMFKFCRSKQSVWKSLLIPTLELILEKFLCYGLCRWQWILKFIVFFNKKNSVTSFSPISTWNCKQIGYFVDFSIYNYVVHYMVDTMYYTLTNICTVHTTAHTLCYFLKLRLWPWCGAFAVVLVRIYSTNLTGRTRKNELLCSKFIMS